MSQIYGRSANCLGERQLLVDHLRNVASLARDFAGPFGGGGLAFLAGLWHDVGKAIHFGSNGYSSVKRESVPVRASITSVLARFLRRDSGRTLSGS